MSPTSFSVFTLFKFLHHLCVHYILNHDWVQTDCDGTFVGSRCLTFRLMVSTEKRFSFWESSPLLSNAVKLKHQSEETRETPPSVRGWMCFTRYPTDASDAALHCPPEDCTATDFIAHITLSTFTANKTDKSIPAVRLQWSRNHTAGSLMAQTQKSTTWHKLVRNDCMTKNSAFLSDLQCLCVCLMTHLVTYRHRWH